MEVRWSFELITRILLAFWLLENLVNNNFHIRRGQTFYCSPKSNWDWIKATNFQTNSQLILILLSFLCFNN